MPHRKFQSNISSSWPSTYPQPAEEQPRDDKGRFISANDEDLVAVHLQRQGLAAGRLPIVVAPKPVDETEEDIVQAHLISQSEALRKFMQKSKTNIQNFYLNSSPGSVNRRLS